MGSPEAGRGGGRAEERTQKTGRGDQAWKGPGGSTVGVLEGRRGHFDLVLKVLPGACWVVGPHKHIKT